MPHTVSPNSQPAVPQIVLGALTSVPTVESAGEIAFADLLQNSQNINAIPGGLDLPEDGAMLNFDQIGEIGIPAKAPEFFPDNANGQPGEEPDFDPALLSLSALAGTAETVDKPREGAPSTVTHLQGLAAAEAASAASDPTGRPAEETTFERGLLGVLKSVFNLQSKTSETEEAKTTTAGVENPVAEPSETVSPTLPEPAKALGIPSDNPIFGQEEGHLPAAAAAAKTETGLPFRADEVSADTGPIPVKDPALPKESHVENSAVAAPDAESEIVLNTDGNDGSVIGSEGQDLLGTSDKPTPTVVQPLAADTSVEVPSQGIAVASAATTAPAGLEPDPVAPGLTPRTQPARAAQTGPAVADQAPADAPTPVTLSPAPAAEPGTANMPQKQTASDGLSQSLTTAPDAGSPAKAETMVPDTASAPRTAAQQANQPAIMRGAENLTPDQSPAEAAQNRPAQSAAPTHAQTPDLKVAEAPALASQLRASQSDGGPKEDPAAEVKILRQSVAPVASAEKAAAFETDAPLTADSLAISAAIKDGAPKRGTVETPVTVPSDSAEVTASPMVTAKPAMPNKLAEPTKAETAATPELNHAAEDAGLVVKTETPVKTTDQTKAETAAKPAATPELNHAAEDAGLVVKTETPVKTTEQTKVETAAKPAATPELNHTAEDVSPATKPETASKPAETIKVDATAKPVADPKLSDAVEDTSPHGKTEGKTETALKTETPGKPAEMAKTEPAAKPENLGIKADAASIGTKPATDPGTVSEPDAMDSVDTVEATDFERVADRGYKFESATEKPAMVAASSQAATTAPAQAQIDPQQTGASVQNAVGQVQAAEIRDVSGSASFNSPSANAAPPAPARSLTMTDTDWPVQLNSILQDVRDLTQGEIEIALQPERLGKMTIKMDMRDNAVAVTIVTDNDAAARMLNDNQSRLAEMMQKSGFDLTQHNASNGQAGQGQAGQAGQGNGQGDRRGQQNTQEAGQQIETAPQNTNSNPDNGIDIIA